MKPFVTYILLAVILLIALLLFVPKKEYFASSLVAWTNEINRDIANNSTNLYQESTYLPRNTAEKQYLKKYEMMNPLREKGVSTEEPLIMNRCIQFINDPEKVKSKDGLTGIDHVLSSMRCRDFFMSNKISIDYNDFNTIETKLKDYINALYAYTNDEQGKAVPQFYGPAYLLVTQYPYVQTVTYDPILDSCTETPTVLSQNPFKLSYNPKPVGDDPRCYITNDEIRNKSIRLEMYLLLPAHKKGGIRTIRHNNEDLDFYTVGEFAYTNWGQIRCNMRDLFAWNRKRLATTTVVDPRSGDDKCFMSCLNPGSNKFNYACGARNSTKRYDISTDLYYNDPYEATVLGTPKTTGEKLRHDYATLYTINPSVMNSLLRMDGTNGIFRECVPLQPIEQEFDFETMDTKCASGAIESIVNGSVYKKLSDFGDKNIGVGFRIKMGIYYIGVKNSSSRIAVLNKIPKGNDYTTLWYLENVYAMSGNIPKKVGFRIFTFIRSATTTDKLYLTSGPDNVTDMTRTDVVLTSKPSIQWFFTRDANGKLELVKYTLVSNIPASMIVSTSKQFLFTIYGSNTGMLSEAKWMPQTVLNTSNVIYSSDVVFEVVVDSIYETTSCGSISPENYEQNVAIAQEALNQSILGNLSSSTKKCKISSVEEEVAIIEQAKATPPPPPPKPKVNEVYQIGGNINPNRDTAQARCQQYGGTLATTEQVRAAFNKGADWCSWGYTTDSVVFPNQEPREGCSMVKELAVLKNMTYNNGNFGAACYGIKPTLGTPTILPFSRLKWSEQD